MRATTTENLLLWPHAVFFFAFLFVVQLEFNYTSKQIKYEVFYHFICIKKVAFWDTNVIFVPNEMCYCETWIFPISGTLQLLAAFHTTKVLIYRNAFYFTVQSHHIIIFVKQWILRFYWFETKKKLLNCLPFKRKKSILNRPNQTKCF